MLINRKNHHSKNSSVYLLRRYVFLAVLFIAQSSFTNSQTVVAKDWKLREIPDANVKSRGLRVIEGKHLVLITDLKSSPETDELPAVFDAAVPEWCVHFGIDKDEVADWRVRGFLMQERERFESAGVLPDGLPDFAHGFAYKGELFFLNQPSNYYQRHLLIHEGTHLFQFNVLKLSAEQWYSEGIAEMFGTHLWKNGKLETCVFPKSLSDFTKWGRIELLEQVHAEGRSLNLAGIRQLQTKAFSKNESYAWTWAVVAVLDNHPRYQKKYRVFQKNLRDKKFVNEFKKTFGEQESLLAQDVAIFGRDAVYNYDWERTAVDFKTGKTLLSGSEKISVTSDRGWQNSGIKVEQGKSYKIIAAGKVELAKTTKPWLSEPGGITIRYHHEKPLGMLLAAISGEQIKRNEIKEGESSESTSSEQPSEQSGEKDLAANSSKPSSYVQFSDPQEIGNAATLVAPRTGTLFFKVNDSAAELSDNRGSYGVKIEREK